MEIEKLKLSPMFNLSLSSKELFHSNFIDWLISAESVLMSDLFTNLLNQKIVIDKCSREKNNFDLMIDCEGDKQIIIENKFKSIITEQQLKRYNEKLRNIVAVKVLLSLNATDYEEKIAKNYDWEVISYDELSKELKKITFTNEYYQSIVQDYCSFVEEISTYFMAQNYSSLKISEMHSETSKLSEIRLHDIYQKILFNYILRELNSLLEKENKDYAIGYDFSKKITAYQDFWRGTGIVTLSYNIKRGGDDRKGFRLEFQLQYHTLKLMIIHKNPIERISEDFRTDYFKIIENISNTKYCRKIGELFPKSKNKIYNKYGQTCIYKSIILSDELVMSEIIDMMYKTFNEIIKFGEKNSQPKESHRLSNS